MVWEPLFAAVDQAQKAKERPLWVTGHSLGGAIALLAAWRFRRNFFAVQEIITFGAPMIGNDTAAKAFRAGILGQDLSLRRSRRRGAASSVREPARKCVSALSQRSCVECRPGRRCGSCGLKASGNQPDTAISRGSTPAWPIRSGVWSKVGSPRT